MDEFQDFQEKTELRVLLFLTVVVDAIFLVLWLVVQWFASKIIDVFNLTSVLDNTIVILIQVLFAISTLYPVLLSMFIDLQTTLIRVRSGVLASRNALETELPLLDVGNKYIDAVLKGEASENEI